MEGVLQLQWQGHVYRMPISAHVCTCAGVGDVTHSDQG